LETKADTPIAARPAACDPEGEASLLPMRKLNRRRDASPLRPLGKIDARYERLPSVRVTLTQEERGLLKDPDWIDEDEADLILALRDEKNSKPGDGIDIREFMRRHGRAVKD